MSRRRNSQRPKWEWPEEEITLGEYIERLGSDPPWLHHGKQMFACVNCSNDGYLVVYDFHLYGMVDPNGDKQRRWNRNQWLLHCQRCGLDRPQYNTKNLEEKYDEETGEDYQEGSLTPEWIFITSRTERDNILHLKFWVPPKGHKCARMRQPFNGFAFSEYWSGLYDEAKRPLPKRGL